MRSTLAIAAFVAGALAVPYNKDQKRDIVTEWAYVTAYDVVTVTAGQEPSAAPEKPKHYGHHNWNTPVPYNPPSPPAPAEKPKEYSPPAEKPKAYSPPAEKPKAYSPPAEKPKEYSPPAEEPQTYSAPASTPVDEPEETVPTYGTPSSDQTSYQAPTDYAGKCVYHHNLHRANHSVADIEWDDGLASIAQAIAESCVYAHNTEEGGGGYGQNIAAGVDAANISAIITDLFYNGEEPYFADQYGKDDPDMTNFELWGHFSQIVWKDTTHVGCATVECPNGLANTGDGVEPVFTVCNYKNPGNYAGEYGANVLQPQGHSSASWNTGSS